MFLPKIQSMKNYLLLIVFLISLLSVISCQKEEPIEQEPLPGQYPKQLTQGNLLDREAFFSPDGKYIAFYSARYTITELSGINLELWTMSRDGFDQKRVILEKSIYDITIPTLVGWTKDSKNMIVHIQDGNWDYKSEIWQVAVTGERTKLYAPNLRLEHLSYSPDYSKLAYIIQGPNPAVGPPVYKLYVANTDFSDSVRIEKGLVDNFKWQSDSKGLIYVNYDPKEQHGYLWKASTDGTSKFRFSDTPFYDENFWCSSDGKYISYSIADSIFITPTDKFLPRPIKSNAIGGRFIPGRNMLLARVVKPDDFEGLSSENVVIDIQGNIIKQLPKYYWGLSFEATGHYFLYTINGDIWMDYLP